MSEKHADDQGGNPDGKSLPPVPSAPIYIERPNVHSEGGERQGENGQGQAAKFVESAKKTATAVAVGAAANIVASIAALAAVIVGVAQCQFNREQIIEMRSARDQSERALSASVQASRLDQRAWVGVKKATIDPVQPGKPVITSVILSNFGKTPARNIQLGARMMIPRVKMDNEAGYKLAQDELMKVEKGRGGVLFPGADSSILIPIRPSVKDEDMADILAGRQTIYLIGEVTYEDVFRETHFTRYFYSYNPTSKTFEVEKRHNESN